MNVMKRLLSLMVVVLISLCLTGAVCAQQKANQVKPVAGIDWYEKVMRERAIKDRAAEERNAMKKAARDGTDFNMNGLTVDSYNNLILQKNGTK